MGRRGRTMRNWAPANWLDLFERRRGWQVTVWINGQDRPLRSPEKFHTTGAEEENPP